MAEFRTIQEVEAELAKYVPAGDRVDTVTTAVQRIEPLLRRLGHPERKLKVVHVAGTSGKTSTCYYLAAMLQGRVGKVGLTVSPYIDTLAERLQVSGRPVDEVEFCEAFTEYMKLIAGLDSELRYFELVIGLAYWYFDKIGVDWAVVEAGMGGTDDATNAAREPSKICVITDIGLDHTRHLGGSIEAIASQKAGIIHSNNLIYMYRQAPAVMGVFQNRAKAVRASLNLFDQSELTSKYSIAGLNDLPEYQQRNWLLARAAYQAICDREGWLPDAERLSKSLILEIPGRMNIFRRGGKTIVMDGAHNQQKMQAFTDSLRAKYPDRRAAVLLAMKEGKEYQAVLSLLKPICDKLMLTTFDVLPDLPAKSINPRIVAAAASQAGFSDVAVIDDPHEAYQQLLHDNADLAIITGSFYLLSVLRPYILKA